MKKTSIFCLRLSTCDMSSDDDKPLVEPLHRKTKLKKKKTPKVVQAKTKPPRYSKYADMHAKEGKAGHTASEDEISDDDKYQSDLSCVISENDNDNDVSSNMQAMYSASLCSQASEHGFGTPMFKKRAKERGISRGSIFEGIVLRHDEKRKKASKRAQLHENPLNTAPIVSPSSLRSPITAVQSIIPSKIASPSSPFSHRSSVTAPLSPNPAITAPPSSHRSSITCHQKVFEDNVCSRGKVNRMRLNPPPSFSLHYCDLSHGLNDTPLHSETTKYVDLHSTDIKTSTGQNMPLLQTFMTTIAMPASCDKVQYVNLPSSSLPTMLNPVEKLRYLDATAQDLSTKVNHLSLISEVCNNLPANDHILPHLHEPNRTSIDCHMPPNGHALGSPLSPLPENFVADSPVSRWDVWRRQPGIRLCNTAVQTSPKQLVPKRSMTPFCYRVKVTSHVCTQTETERHDAAVQTLTPEDDTPLTLKNLKDELKAFAIAFGF